MDTNVLSPETSYVSSRRLLTVEQTAHYLGVGRTKAAELIYSGELASLTIGRARRVEINDIERFIRQQKGEVAYDDQ